MYCAPGILEKARDLAALIDPDGCGLPRAREINLDEDALFQEKAMLYVPASRKTPTI